MRCAPCSSTPHGRIWAGTLDRGLDLIDPRTGTARHFRHQESDAHSLASDAVFALHQDHAGGIWIGTDGGLSHYQSESGTFINYGRSADGGGLSDPQVRVISEDHTGALWIGTLHGGLDRLEPGSGHVNVYRHDPANPRSLSHDRVTAVLEDGAQRLWVATADGLDLFDLAHEGFVRYGNDADNPQSLRDSNVMALYQDRGGVLWVGTRAGGVSHWNPNSWLLGHYRSASFHDTPVMSFAADGAGRVWVGTMGAGLIEIDGRSGAEHHYGRDTAGLRLSDDRVTALLYEQGALWIGTFAGGLARLDVATQALSSWRAGSGPNALPADGVMTLHADRQGAIWVGTFGGGLARIDAGGRAGDPLPLRPRRPRCPERRARQRHRRGRARQSVDRHRRRRSQPARARQRPLLALPPRRPQPQQPVRRHRVRAARRPAR